jgi:hypothetical protein
MLSFYEEAFELFERNSESNVSDKPQKLRRSSRLNQKSELPASFRGKEKVVVKRVRCRNFELRYLKTL